MTISREEEANMMAKHDKIPRSFASQYYIPNMDYEDVAQIARISLLRAIRTYDPEKGKFFTWACWLIRNDLKSTLRKAKYNETTSLQLPAKDAAYGSETDLTQEDTIEHKTPSITERLIKQEELKEVMEFILNCLRPIEQYFIFSSASGATQSKIATEAGVNQSSISRIKNRTDVKIRNRWHSETPKKFTIRPTLEDTIHIQIATPAGTISHEFLMDKDGLAVLSEIIKPYLSNPA